MRRIRGPVLGMVGVLAAILFAGCAATSPSGPVAPSGGQPVADREVATIEVETFDAVNDRRASSGVSALAWDDALAALAREHSDAMASGRVPFGHAGVQERLRRALARSGTHRAAENVSSQPRPAGEVAAASIDRWRASPRHRGNMLGAFSATGIGVARAPDGRFFVTQIFVE